MTTHPLECPCCHLTDATQRVQAAYRAGLQSSTTSGTATSLSYDSGHFIPTVTGFGARTQQQTQLSELLAPPRHPVYRSTELATGRAAICGVGVLFVALVLTAALAAVPVLAYLAFVVCCLGGIVPCAWAYRTGLPAEARARAYNQALRAAHDHALTLWSLALVCHRCDVTWVPGAGGAPCAV